MSTVQVIGLLVFLALVVAVLNRRAFGKLWDTASSQIGKGARWAWSRDPVAQLQYKIDNAADEISNSTKDLQRYRGLYESSKRQVEDGQKMCANLDAQIKLAVKEDKEDKAAKYAEQLIREREHLEINKKQLQNYDQGYQSNLKKIKAARAQVVDAREQAQRLGAELQMSKVDREMGELSQKLNIKTTSLNDMGDITNEIQRQIDENRAASIVQADIGADDLDEIQEKESIQKESAKALLEEYKKKTA